MSVGRLATSLTKDGDSFLRSVSARDCLVEIRRGDGSTVCKTGRLSGLPIERQHYAALPDGAEGLGYFVVARMLGGIIAVHAGTEVGLQEFVALGALQLELVVQFL
ncbi:RNA-splicing ligase RtcB [Babesia caballi]|uniref:RNA-splicing ligase RtcB n=1 Tax=Babesia caballi TaxID=5871 RepID=A0AAV4LTH1_BABCB|nr:RNA-splicing ligase RtcB [Babesia caballi]